MLCVNRILLADDDEDDIQFFKDALIRVSDINSILNTVNDGVSLMAVLHCRTTPLPNIIFLDLNMPGKNGMECLREIRADERLQQIPIAIYSTFSTEKDIQGTFNEGANLYIIKPTNSKTLKNIITEVLHTDWTQHQSWKNRDAYTVFTPSTDRLL